MLRIKGKFWQGFFAASCHLPILVLYDTHDLFDCVIFLHFLPYTQQLIKRLEQPTCRKRLGKSSALLTLRMPFPPPPSEALIITGYPTFSAACQSEHVA